MTKKLCFTCDLKDQPKLIEEYKDYHRPGNTWSSIISSIRESGVTDMEIYLVGTRMFMIMEVSEHFSLEKKREMDLASTEVVEWENLMSTFQKPYGFKGNKTKWLKMEKIFHLEEHD